MNSAVAMSRFDAPATTGGEFLDVEGLPSERR